MRSIYDEEYYESKTNYKTDTLDFGAMGGVGQLAYHLYKFSDYTLSPSEDGTYNVCAICKPGSKYMDDASDTLTGKALLASLCNLAKKIDDRSWKGSSVDAIMEWCEENAHPYNIDILYETFSEPNFDNDEEAFIVEKEASFKISDFMQDLGKLYYAARFYLALEDVCVGADESAYNLYSEGRYFEAPAVFEQFKYKLPEIADFELSDDVVADMERDWSMRAAAESAADRKAESANSDGPTFKEEPYDHYEKLRNDLIGGFPSFNMRLKVDKRSSRVVLCADVISVFDIAWYSLARLIAEEPAPKNIGKQDDIERQQRYREGAFICCHNCGDFFIRRHSRHEYCDKPECQKTRNAKNQREFRKRQKAKSAHNKLKAEG